MVLKKKFLWLLVWERSGRIYPSPLWGKNKVCVEKKKKLSGWKNETRFAVYLFICFHIKRAFQSDINLTTLISGWAWNMSVEMRVRGFGGGKKEEMRRRKKKVYMPGFLMRLMLWIAQRKKCHISFLLKRPAPSSHYQGQWTNDFRNILCLCLPLDLILKLIV